MFSELQLAIGIGSVVAYTIGAVGLTATIVRIGTIRASACPSEREVRTLRAECEYVQASYEIAGKVIETYGAELSAAKETIADLTAKSEQQARDLAAIEAMVTPGANATVRRMAAVARRAA